jgi:hypothetical protein
MTIRFKLVFGLAALLAVAIFTAALAGKGSSSASRFDAAHSDFTPQNVRGFREFPLYSLGDTFEGLPLKAIVRRADEPYVGEDVTANFVSFTYGDCFAEGDLGCPFPIEVQVWPACERSRADYALTPEGDALPSEDLRVRGVPAAFYEEGLRLELYSGDVTVVIFGLEREQTMRAARALKGVNGALGRGENLPPPAAGALEGELDCGA